MVAIAVHSLMMLVSVSASAFPFPYRWDRFPAAWFGANATAFESEEQMDFIAQVIDISCVCEQFESSLLVRSIYDSVFPSKKISKSRWAHSSVLLFLDGKL